MKRIRLCLIILCLLVLSGCGQKVDYMPSFSAGPVVSASPTPAPLKEYEFSDDQIQILRSNLAHDQSINPDCTAFLVFKSALVKEVVLKGIDNTTYLYTDWETGNYRSYGSLMMDYENQTDQEDMNTIIYGHYVYASKNPNRYLEFTPLEKLQNFSNYEENKYLALVTDYDIRYYQVAVVYDCPMVSTPEGQTADEGYQFNQITYSPEYFEEYLKNIKSREYYDTGVELTDQDKLLTLQTCIEDQDESRQIVVCKELERSAFE